MLSQLFSNGLELFSSIESFWEDHICSSINIRNGSLNTLLQAIDTLSISPSTDDKLSIRHFNTSLSSDAYFSFHVLCRDELFAQ